VRALRGRQRGWIKLQRTLRSSLWLHLLRAVWIVVRTVQLTIALFPFLLEIEISERRETSIKCGTLLAVVNGCFRIDQRSVAAFRVVIVWPVVLS